MKKLATTPSQKPKFAVESTLKNGTKIICADPKASRAMITLMDMNAVLGGAAAHFGGPSAFAELMSATHALMFHDSKEQNKAWDELFNFVNDAGHCENGLYALKANYGFADLTLQDLRHFRSIKSKLTGHGEVHLFSEGVLLSNGPLGSAFPQSQGLAMADALNGSSRVTITAISDGACMEGEARESLAAIPGFAQNGQLAPFILIISDNNTKLSGRIDKDCFSMEPTFQSLKTMGWEVLELKEGHNLQKCVETIEMAIETARSNPKKPIAIHARTIKGYGTKKTAESSSGAHGFPLKGADELHGFISEIYQGAALPTEFSTWCEELKKLEQKIKAVPAPKPQIPEEKIQVGVANAMIQARKEGLPVVSITSDLPGSTGVAGFRKEYPQFSLDVGVAESNMISVAAGFAKAGFIPVVDTFAQFGVTKGALPLTMAMLSEAPIIAVFSHTGFQDAADGASHQALTYLSMVASIPNVKAYALTCPNEAQAVMLQAFKQFEVDKNSGNKPTSYVFFLGRENFPKHYENASFNLNKAQIIRQSSTTPTAKSVTIIAAGSMLTEALIAHDELLKNNVHSTVINPLCLNQLDVETIKSALNLSGGRVLTVEDHQLLGGFSAIVAQTLALNNINFSMKSLGVKGEFGQSAYSAKELYQKHHIDSQAIIENAMAWFA
jgi:transketolase